MPISHSTGEPQQPQENAPSRRTKLVLIWGTVGCVLLGGTAWYALGDGVRMQAWEIERSLNEDLFDEVDITVERSGESYFTPPPRRITAFDVQLSEHANPEEVGTQLEQLAQEHEILPDMRVGDATTIQAFQRYSSSNATAELTPDAWAQVISHADSSDVLEIDVWQDGRNPGDYGVTMKQWVPLYDEALDVLEEWEQLETPEGVDHFSAHLDAGLPQVPLERSEDSPWLIVERVGIRGPLDTEEGLPARELLENAAEEEAFGEVDEFLYQDTYDSEADCVVLSIRNAPESDEEPSEELIAAAEDYAHFAESRSPKEETEVRIGSLWGTSNEDVLHREANTAHSCS